MFLEQALATDDIGGVAAGEQGLDVWPHPPDFLVYLPAVRLRHDHIEEQAVDLLAEGLVLAQTVLAVFRFDDTVAELFQYAPLEVAENRIVLYQQDRFVSSPGGADESGSSSPIAVDAGR